MKFQQEISKEIKYIEKNGEPADQEENGNFIGKFQKKIPGSVRFL